MAEAVDAGKLAANKIFVRKIPKEATHADLEVQFLQFGPVRSAKISLDIDHQSRGFGYVFFENAMSANRAIHVMQDADQYQVHGYLGSSARGKEHARVFNNVYVKNLPVGFTEQQLRSLFGKFGRIESLNMT